MATWIEKSRSPEYSPAKLSQMLAGLEYVLGIDELDAAMAHETIIAGGYLNTHLIKANSILAKHMDVGSLSAISANIGEVTSGKLRSPNNSTWINLDDGTFSFSDGALTSSGVDIPSPNSTFYSIKQKYGVLENKLSSLELNLTNQDHDTEMRVQSGGVWLRIQDIPRVTMAWNAEGNNTIFRLSDLNGSSLLRSTTLSYHGQDNTTLSRYESNQCIVDGSIWADNLYLSGDKSRVIETENYGEVTQYAIETPTPFFIDMGHGVISDDGFCYIDIEEVFSETVDLESDYYIQTTKYGEGDIWVSKKEPEYFVIEGTPNLKFAWEIKVKQKSNFDKRLERVSRIKENEETDYIELASEYLIKHNKELIT